MSDVTTRIQICVMLIVPPFMLQLGWVHVRVLSTREGQWGLFGGLWVCIIVNRPLTEPPVPKPRDMPGMLMVKNRGKNRGKTGENRGETGPPGQG